MSILQESALEGIRVLEVSEGTAGYCGKLLADLGADVIKVESPLGDPARHQPPFVGGRPGDDRSLGFLYMNANKRSVVLDLATEPGQQKFRRLAASSALVIESLPPGQLESWGLGLKALSEDHPGLVLTSISGFGQTGPHRDFRSGDLVASAVGGSMYVTGDPDDSPVRLAGSQSVITACTTAAASSLIALHHSRRSGCGQHVDISMQEVTTAVAHICGVGKWLDDGIIPLRNGTSLFASVPSGAYPCQDGLVYLMVNRPLHWKALAQWIHEETGNEEVTDSMFEGPSSNRIEYRELLDIFIGDLSMRYEVQDFYHEAQARHLAVTPVNTTAMVTADPHLAARNFFVDLDHPVAGPLRLPSGPFRGCEASRKTDRPAPSLGQHGEEIEKEIRMESAPQNAKSPAPKTRPPKSTDSTALGDLRVIEFTAAMAGPWIGRFLSYCGADTIRVESHKRPDVVRLYIPPWDRDLGIQPQLSPWFTDWNAGKRFVALDLTRPDAVEIAKKLVAKADVVVENYSTGVMKKLGLDYSELVKVNPSIVMISTNGYGDEGPCSHYVTWGSNVEAISGLSHLSGPADRPCTTTQYAYPDAMSALHGLGAVMAALRQREQTGRGQYISLSQFEATAATLGPLLMEYFDTGTEPEKRGNRSQAHAPHGCYRCRGDDRWCAIAISSDPEWKAFCEACGHPEWLEDSRFSTVEARLAHTPELDHAIEQWTGARDATEVMNTLQRAGIAAGVVQTVEDQYRHDPHLQSRGFFEQIPHDVKGTVIAAGIPLGLTGTPGSSRKAGAAVGQDNDAVFRELLKMSDTELNAAKASGAIETAD